MKKFRAFPTVVSLLATLVTAGLASAMNILGKDGFNALNKPSFQPPDIVFPIVWGAIYILSFFSASLYFSAAGDKTAGDGARNTGRVTALYITMAVLHVLWSLAVFVLLSPPAGVAIILAYIAVVVLTMRSTAPVSRISCLLLAPQVVWLLFALALKYALAMLD